jgi:hypothetical protein
VGYRCRVDRVLHDTGRRSYDALLSTADHRVEGIILHVVALAEIIASKRRADRPKDRAALPELEELERRRTT